MTSKLLPDFQALVDWSLEGHSDLPWRYNRTLYSTLVSEIMLQQTTVPTVLGKFESFMKEFPAIESLALIDEDGLRKAWKGLGYYRRAANLLKAVRFIQEDKAGQFPETREELQEIPGIGPYTAGAIRSIGMDLPDLALDGNLKRVLTRYFDIDTLYGPKLEKELLKLLENKHFAKTISTVGSRNLNEALMDLGREVCKASRAYCERCMLSTNCLAKKNNSIAERPFREKKEKQKLIPLSLYRFIVENEAGEVLLYKKNSKEWLSDQWELPTVALNPDEKFKQYPMITDQLILSSRKTIKTAITKYKISNHPSLISEEELDHYLPKFCKKRETLYVSKAELLAETSTVHISTASEKVLRSL